MTTLSGPYKVRNYKYRGVHRRTGKPREGMIEALDQTRAIEQLEDRNITVTVIRDGATICTLDAHSGEVTEDTLIKNMVGRSIENIYPPRTTKPQSDTVLEVNDWNAYNPATGRTLLKDVAFNVKRGEIVGVAGLMGSGRTELALSLFGNPYHYRVSGELMLNVAGNLGAGNILSGTLESSNVDLAQEMTDLIMVQRAYSSNAKIVTTADELLQEANNLKR